MGQEGSLMVAPEVCNNEKYSEVKLLKQMREYSSSRNCLQGIILPVVFQLLAGGLQALNRLIQRLPKTFYRENILFVGSLD